MKVDLKGVDTFKLLAAIGIVAIHCSLPVLSSIGRLGVPYFIIISSYFFFKHYLAVKQGKNVYLKKYVRSLLFLFLSWEIFYIPIAINNSIKLFKTLNGFNIYSLFYWILAFCHVIPSDVSGWGPSWYIIAMIIGIPVFLLLYKILKGNLFALGILCFSIEVYYVLASGYGSWTHLPVFGIYFFPRMLVYIYIGLLIEKYSKFFCQKKLLFYVKISFCLFVLFMLENTVIYMFNGSPSSEEIFLTAPTSWAMSLLSVKWQPKFKTSVEFRKFSTFLYCFQAIAIFLFEQIIKEQVIFAPLLVKNICFLFVILSAWISFKIYGCILKKIKWNFLSYMV